MKNKKASAGRGTAAHPGNTMPLRIILAVSAFLFWILTGFFWMLSDLILSYAVCYVLLGLLSSFVVSRAGKFRFSTGAMIAGAVVPCVICYISFRYFLSEKFLTAVHFLLQFKPRISELLGGAAGILQYTGMLLTVLSFPFMYYVSTYAIHYVTSLCGRDSIRHFAVALKKTTLRSAAFTHLRFFAHIAAAVVAGIALLCAVYAIPTGPIDKNVSRSAASFEGEGSYPFLVSWCSSQADNYADSIILLEAADDTDAPLAELALMNYRGSKKEFWKPNDLLVQHYCYGEPFDRKAEYSRYWHGYLIFIKPLFYFTDLKGIRLINLAVQLLLAALLCLTLERKKQRGLIIPFIISYLMLKPVLISRCFEYSSCYYVIVLGGIALLCAKDVANGRKAHTIFLYIGIAVAYFDFLTYPAAAFGIPAVIYMFMLSDSPLSEKMLKLFKAGYSWLFGYAVMWLSKWIVGTVFIDTKVIKLGFGEFVHRISRQENDLGPVGSLSESLNNAFCCLVRNTVYFFDNPFIILFIAFIVIMMIRLRKYRNTPSQASYRLFAPYAFLAAVPYFWYLFAQNHSSVHYLFTNKALALTVMAVTAGAADLLKRFTAENRHV